MKKTIVILLFMAFCSVKGFAQSYYYHAGDGFSDNPTIYTYTNTTLWLYMTDPSNSFAIASGFNNYQGNWGTIEAYGPVNAYGNTSSYSFSGTSFNGQITFDTPGDYELHMFTHGTCDVTTNDPLGTGGIGMQVYVHVD